MSQCIIEDCARPAVARGWCRPHYRRWYDTSESKRQVQPRPHNLPIADRFWPKVNRGGSEDCWEWNCGRDKRGYGQFAVGQPGRRRPKNAKAHRVAWELVRGPIPSGLLILHRCDNPPCCNPEHLFLGTYKNNTDDMYRKNRQYPNWLIPHARGEQVGLAKLTEEGVRDIRRRYASGGITQRRLATEYGVGQAQISHVVRRETWRHVA